MRLNPCFKLTFTLALVLLALSPHAQASTGGSMPWDNWLTQLGNSFTGPLAYVIAVIGFVTAMAVIVLRGAELGHLVLVILVLVIGASVALGAKQFASQFGVGSGDLVPLPTRPAALQPLSQGGRG
jgi:type IV secretory pathway VirB2 component (pilin)